MKQKIKMKTAFNVGLFDMQTKTIRTIPITATEWDFLESMWEKPLKNAVCGGESVTEIIAE